VGVEERGELMCGSETEETVRAAVRAAGEGETVGVRVGVRLEKAEACEAKGCSGGDGVIPSAFSIIRSSSTLGCRSISVSTKALLSWTAVMSCMTDIPLLRLPVTSTMPVWVT
jgi:hypothetical protein